MRRGRITSAHRVVAIGFDIQPNGLYSVVGIDEHESIVFKQENVSLPRLIRLVWEYKPRLLATDNIMELGGDETILRKVLSMLPDETEVVQVTKDPRGGFIDIRSLAALAGIRIEGKPSPIKTAYLVALLAKRGYGARVVFTEEKTKIIITRARHGSAGGMSQARYQRGVKAGILRATRVIKKLLDKHGFDYDMIFRKSGYGLESAVFIVYAPRHKLQGIIRNFKGRDIRVEIRPVYTGKILFETLHNTSFETNKHLIVGVDPGIVTAVAAIDLQGKPVFVYSRKGLDRAEIIELIKKHGEAVMIATDVTPPPDNVKKLAASLGVPLYTPPYPLSVEEKQNLVSELSHMLGNHKLNAHERDALAAAIRAYREYASKLRQIESIASRYPAEISVENLKASVIRGLTIAEALEAEIERLLIEKQPKPVRQVRHMKNTMQHVHNGNNGIQASEKLEAAKARIKVLENELQKCRERVKSLENELRLAKLEASQYHRDKLVEYEYRIRLLQHELDKLRQEKSMLDSEIKRMIKILVELSLGSLVLVPAVKTVTHSIVSKLAENPLFRVRRVIYIAQPHKPDAATIDELKQLNPIVILPRTNGNDVGKSYQASGIPVVMANKDDVIMYAESSGVAVIRSELLEEAYLAYLEMKAKSYETEAMEDRILDASALKKLVDAYRRARYESMHVAEDSENETITSP